MKRSMPGKLMPPGLKAGGLLFVAAVCLLLAPPSAQAQIDFSGLWNDLSPAVVSVETPSVGTGSGFVVQYDDADGDPTWGILTACHVVSNAPRPFAREGRTPQVQVAFRAWQREVQLTAGVVGCDVRRDVALLQPLDTEGNLTTLPNYFQTLAAERNSAKLRSFPRLWLSSDGAELNPLTSVFAIGYPGPFSELNAVMGRVSAQLPVSYVQASDGTLFAGEVMIVYEGPSDVTLDEDSIRQIQQIAGLRVDQIAQLARRILKSGLGMLIVTSDFPGSDQSTGWDVVSLDDGLVQVQERPIQVTSGLFGTTVTILPRRERLGTVAFEQRFMRLDAPVGSGFSGSPVMNTSGQVVGMVQWGLQSTEGGHFALPVQALGAALRDLSAAADAGK